MITAVLVLAVIVVAFLLFVTTRPNSFRVQRSVQISASSIGSIR
jgi:hypothetical protein